MVTRLIPPTREVLVYTTDEQNVHVMPLARPNLGVKAACTAYNVQQRASRPRLSRVW